MGGEGSGDRVLRDGAGAVNARDGKVRLAVPGAVGEGLGSVGHGIAGGKAAVELGAASFQAGDALSIGVPLGAAGGEREFDFVETGVVGVLDMLESFAVLFEDVNMGHGDCSLKHGCNFVELLFLLILGVSRLFIVEL